MQRLLRGKPCRACPGGRSYEAEIADLEHAQPSELGRHLSENRCRLSQRKRLRCSIRLDGKPPGAGVTGATTAGHILAKRASISGHAGSSKRDHIEGTRHARTKGLEASWAGQEECGNRTPLP